MIGYVVDNFLCTSALSQNELVLVRAVKNGKICNAMIACVEHSASTLNGLNKQGAFNLELLLLIWRLKQSSINRNITQSPVGGDKDGVTVCVVLLGVATVEVPVTDIL